MLPFDPDEVRLEPSKHFRNARMRKWDWDLNDLREALHEPIRVEKRGKPKLEIWVRKGGSKKLVVAHYAEEKVVLVITGTEG